MFHLRRAALLTLFSISVLTGTSPAQIVVSGGLVGSGGIIATAPIPSVQITTTSPLPNCTFSVPFTFTFNATGGVAPYAWSLFAGSLQPGLSLSSAGVLSGTCTNTSGAVTFTVQVCDAEAPAACTTGVFQQTAQNTPPPTLVVCDSTSSPTCPNPPSTGVVGTFYSYNFSAIGGTAPYSWAVTSGAIPTGLSLTSVGVLSGFPSAAGTFSFTVTVTDSTTPTPATANAAFSATISGFSGNPAVAKEPQSWTTGYQGGQNLTTGNPCAQSDATGACARNLPKVCDAGHNCVHEQLGFGTNDHPATLAGLYQAGCDWTQLAQNKYLWVEVKKGSVITGTSHYTSSLFGNADALYVAPVKMAGLSTPMLSGLSACAAATSTPIGPYTLAGSFTSGTAVLGEQFVQQTSNASANLLWMNCALVANSTYPAPWIPGSTGGTSPVLPNCADAGDSQAGPISLGMFTGGTPDSNNAHLWIGQTSGAVFTQSAQAATNGYFRLTTECDDSNTNVPCNGLADQVPCFHSITDASLVYNPTCSNDLPSMFTIEATTLGVNNSNQIEQDGENTSLSGFELTFMQGQNQSLPGSACPNGLNCTLSPQLFSIDCGACGFDHIWVHGWDPGDPALHAGDPSQLSVAAANYLPTPGTSPTQYNCPGYAYFSTLPPGGNMTATFNLNASSPVPYNQPQYANGCGDDAQAGVTIDDGGYSWSEFYAITKIHKNGTESHNFSIGNAADNLNPNGAGINGPHKFAQAVQMGSAEGGLFFGGSPVHPVSNVAINEEVRNLRVMADPGYRYLSGTAGNSPTIAGGYGCGNGSGKVANICPMVWAMKKNFEIKWCLQCLIDGILLEGMWPDAQTGEEITIDVRVCSGGDDCGIFNPDGTPMTVTNDITISNSVIRNASGGLTLAPRSGTPGNGGGVSGGMNRVRVSNVLLYNFDQNEFGGSKGGDTLSWGANGNTYVNGVASRTSNIASITYDVGTVAPNPLSYIATCGPTGTCNIPSNQGGGTIPNGSAYVNFNGQREDPLAPTGTTGPCLSSNGSTVIPCGTMLFSGGTYDTTWNTMTGASSGGAITTVAADLNGSGYDVGGNFNVVQGSNTSAVIQVATTTHPALSPLTWTIITPGSGYTAAFGLSLTPSRADPATVDITASPLTGPFDCRTIIAGECKSTAGTTNVWAPLCEGGPGASSAMIGQACHNCGASGNAACPPFGCADASCTVGTELPTDVVCNGTGMAPGCGPANATFQTYAFSILDISPGDIVFNTGCSDSSFNQPVSGYPVVENAYACTSGQTGTFPDGTTWSCPSSQKPASLTVIFPSEGLNISNEAAKCQINNGAGWQRNFIVDHVGGYTGGKMQLNASLFGVATQQENSQLTNSIFYFGGSGNGIYCAGAVCKNGEASHAGAGGATAYQSFDQTTNQIHHDAFALPTTTRAGYYKAVGLLGSTICGSGPTPGNCTGGAAAVLKPFCTGATQTNDGSGDPTCIGFTGWLSTTGFPSTTYNGTDCTDPVLAHCPLVSPPWGSFDYHNFALCPSCGTGATANTFTAFGSDGLQLGPCLANSTTNCSNAGLGTTMISIDKALTRKLYVCTGTCGTGPWPD